MQDNFLTPTGMFADLVLPACTQFETWGVEDGWKYGDEVILQPKLVEPPGECKSDYRICAELAERLGFGEAYTEGRDEKGWVDWCLDRYRETRFPDLPTLDEFIEQNLGAYTQPVTQPAIAFADFRRDPQKHPLNTPSGKIEIFSKALYDMGSPDEIPAVPKYIPEWENPFPEQGKVKKYPLQAIGHHSLARVHSTHANNDWLQEAFPQRLFINPLDAAARGIQDGDLVRAWNERGALVLPAGSRRASCPAWWISPRAPGGSRMRTAWTGVATSTCSPPTAGRRWRLPRRSIPSWLRWRSIVHDLRLHLRRQRLHGLQSLPGGLPGQERPARRGAVALGDRGRRRGVAARGQRLGKQRLRLQPVAGVQPLRASQVRRGLPGGCLPRAPGWHRAHRPGQMHGLRLLRLGLPLWRAAVHRRARGDEQVQLLL